MKIKLEESSIILVAENFADKMYIARFIKKSQENQLGENMEVIFRYSEERMNTIAPIGGGYLDPKKIVETIFEAEDAQWKKKDRVAIEEITELEISNYSL